MRREDGGRVRQRLHRYPRPCLGRLYSSHGADQEAPGHRSQIPLFSEFWVGHRKESLAETHSRKFGPESQISNITGIWDVGATYHSG